MEEWQTLRTANVCAAELNESPVSVDSALWNEAADFVRIRVQDTGHGIPAALQASIFEPFFTTKPLGEGTGLGLATSKGIIEQHGGDILCHSSPNAGACFDVFLPAIPLLAMD